VQEFEDGVQRERVLRSQREQQGILGGRGLELEVELAAEPLPERQAPGPIHSAPKGGVDDKLHAAGFIEEPLGDDGLLRGQAAEQALSLAEVLDELMSGRPRRIGG
jgi:hypothetical protein